MTKINLLTKQEQTDIEDKFTITKGERGWGRDKVGVWD